MKISILLVDFFLVEYLLHATFNYFHYPILILTKSAAKHYVKID